MDNNLNKIDRVDPFVVLIVKRGFHPGRDSNDQTNGYYANSYV
jgi:hypothetical protein